jgi:F0F1-type ATP synthase assembly protein I
MKILKYIGSILFDAGKILVEICALLLILGVVGAIAIGILIVIAGSSGLVSKLFGGNEYVLYGCMILWVVGIFSLFEGANPIKGIIGIVIDIKHYFIKKWNKIN